MAFIFNTLRDTIQCVTAYCFTTNVKGFTFPIQNGLRTCFKKPNFFNLQKLALHVVKLCHWKLGIKKEWWFVLLLGSLCLQNEPHIASKCQVSHFVETREFQSQRHCSTFLPLVHSLLFHFFGSIVHYRFVSMFLSTLF